MLKINYITDIFRLNFIKRKKNNVKTVVWSLKPFIHSYSGTEWLFGIYTWYYNSFAGWEIAPERIAMNYKIVVLRPFSTTVILMHVHPLNNWWTIISEEYLLLPLEDIFNIQYIL